MKLFNSIAATAMGGALLVLGACGTSSTFTLGDYYKDLEAAGYVVSDKSEKLYQMVGAVDGAGFEVNGDSCEAYEFDLTTKSGQESLNKVKEEGFLGFVFPETNRNLAVHCSGKGKGAKGAYQVLSNM